MSDDPSPRPERLVGLPTPQYRYVYGPHEAGRQAFAGQMMGLTADWKRAIVVILLPLAVVVGILLLLVGDVAWKVAGGGLDHRPELRHHPGNRGWRGDRPELGTGSSSRECCH